MNILYTFIQVIEVQRIFFFNITYLQTMKITINNKEYTVKYTIRALFVFEQITGKPFGIKTLLDNYLFFYSMILANNPDNPIDWDEFIDALDNDKNLLQQLSKIVEDYQKQDNLFADEESGSEKKS